MAEDVLTPSIQDISAGYEVVKIQDLRSKHVGKNVSIEGYVNNIGTINARIVEAAFECARCDEITKVIQNNRGSLREPLYCKCNEKKRGTFRLLFKESLFIDVQRIQIQSANCDYNLDVDLSCEHVGMVTIGNHVIINGVLDSVQKRTKSGRMSTLFDLVLIADSIEKVE